MQVKATGIVRRIDDLGRVVIPKEIRRTMHIREGAPLEIFTSDDGDIIFRKYSPLGEFPQVALQCAEAINKITRYTVYICDRERVVSAAGPTRREITGKKITGEMTRMMQERGELSGERSLMIADGQYDTVNYVSLIIASSDVIGCVALSVESNIIRRNSELDKKFADIAAAILSKQAEE